MNRENRGNESMVKVERNEKFVNEPGYTTEDQRLSL